MRKYIYDHSHVIEPDTTQYKENLTYVALPIKITERTIKQLRGKQIPLVKVAWNDVKENATWALEDKI